MTGSKVNEILIFMSVVDTGTFQSAAKAFGLSRSATGKAVSRLEARYGVRLLNRTTRAISMTAEGATLYEHGAVLRDAIAATDADMANSAGQPSGKLRVTAADAVGRRLLLPVVQRFQQDWPMVRVEISFSDTVSRIVEDGFDLAVRLGVRTPDASLITRQLMVEKLVLCASPKYLESRGVPANIEQLSNHDLLKFASLGQSQNWALQDQHEIWNRVPGQVRLRMDSAEALREATLLGLGIAILPRSLVDDDLQTGALAQVLGTVNCGEVPLLALYPHKKFLEPSVRQFLDILIAQAGSAL